jgi:hypothetical protein
MKTTPPNGATDMVRQAEAMGVKVLIMERP